MTRTGVVSTESAAARAALGSLLRREASPTWELPELPSLNRLPPAAAVQREPRLLRSLDGTWRFRLAHDPDEAVERADSGTPVEVPGLWTMQGFEPPHYTNERMPFPEPPPRTPRHNPTGVYWRGFEIPRAWAGRRIVVGFAGVEGMLALAVNGHAVGFSKDARTPAEFDVTELVEIGRPNEVVACVVRWSDASFLEDQDQWWHAGIARGVYAYAGSIADVRATIALDASYRDGAVHVDAPGAESASLTDAAGHTLAAGDLPASLEVAAPRLWSAESPSLYTLRVAAADEAVTCRIGFRAVEIRDRHLLVNGRPVRIHGVNRHEHDDTRGRAVPPALSELDARLMKQFNVNAVRTAHYPHDSYWIELCDRYGLYVVDEANIECNAHLELSDDPRWARAWLERVQYMVERDKNSPSVIVWSLGNESGYGANHDLVVDWLRVRDPGRPIFYEGVIREGWSRGHGVTDVVCPMYPEIADLEAHASRDDDPRPIILSEYSHAMGNSNGGLSDYFAAFERHAALQGGFLWEWVDHGIRRTASDGRAYWAYGSDFGQPLNDGNFCVDGIVWPDRTPHPALYELKFLARPIAVERVGGSRFRIVNRNSFAGLGRYAGEWVQTADGARVAGGVLPTLAAGPGDSMDVDIATVDAEGEEHVTFRFTLREAEEWAPAGHEVAWQQFERGAPGRGSCRVESPAAIVPPTVSKRRIVLEGGGTMAVVDERTGALVELVAGGGNTIVEGPRLQLWRAPTDNDGIRFAQPVFPQALPRWLELGLDRLEQRVEFVRTHEKSVEVVTRASGRERWRDVEHRQRYSVLETGELMVESLVELAEELRDLPRVGVVLRLPETLAHLEWFGLGPFENYPDRRAAAVAGVFAGTIADEYVPYIVPQEHGHHGDARWLALTDGHGFGLEVRGVPTIGFSASRFTAGDLSAAAHTCELVPRPEVVLSLDHDQRGLGSRSCGPETTHRLMERAYEFSYVLRPVAPRSGQPMGE